MKNVLPSIMFFCVLATIAGILIYRYMRKPDMIARPPEITQSPPLIQSPIQTIHLNNETYAYDVITVNDPDGIVLIPNFEEKLDSRSFMQQYACTQAASGGFYDTEGRPLGLWEANGQTIREAVNNRLINGFLWLYNKRVTISREPPTVPAVFALQTGPLLIFDGDKQSLAIANDERARRVVAAIDDAGNAYFIVLFIKDAVFDGPFLAELPSLITQLSAQANINVLHALNLDGGSASAFYGPTTKLSELTSVGSFFCIQ